MSLCGTRQIEMWWETCDIYLVKEAYLPFNISILEQWTTILDIPNNIIYGEDCKNYPLKTFCFIKREWTEGVEEYTWIIKESLKKTRHYRSDLFSGTINNVSPTRLGRWNSWENIGAYVTSMRHPEWRWSKICIGEGTY